MGWGSRVDGKVFNCVEPIVSGLKFANFNNEEGSYLILLRKVRAHNTWASKVRKMMVV